MALWLKRYLFGVLLAIPGALCAVTVNYDAYDINMPRFGENRRNPGNMGPVAAGDFNGDGIDDIAFGSPRSAAILTANSGNVFVIYGSDAIAAEDFYDLTAQPNQASNGLFSRLYTNNAEGFQLLPERGGEQFGQSLASGDFDGDGYDDLAIGAPALFGTSSPGAVYLLYGRDDSITTHPLSGLETIDTQIFDNEAFEVKGQGAYRSFGEVVMLSDLDGDGKDDLIIGSPNNVVNDSVHVVWGRPRNISPISFRLSRAQIGSFDQESVIGGALTGEMVGSSFAAADVGFGPQKELFVGCPGWPGGAFPRGRVIMMSLSKPPSGYSTSNIISNSLDYRTPEVGAEFGRSIAIGQIDPDAPDELVIGAPGGDSQKGKVFVVKPALALFPSSVDVPTSSSIMFTQSQFGARMGQHVAIESVDNFPGRDLIIGAPGFDSVGGDLDHGRAYIVSNDSIPIGSLIDIDGTSLNGVSIQGFPKETQAGYYFAFGDFDSTVNLPASGDAFPRKDMIISSSGLSTYDGACTSNNQLDWSQCNTNETGTRAFLGRSILLSTSSTSEAWNMLP